MLPCANAEPRGVHVGSDGSLIDIPVDEVIAAVRQDDRPLIVCARRRFEAEEFRAEHDLPRPRTIYATRWTRGWSRCHMVVLPGFHDRPDVERIWEAILPGLLVGPRYPRWAGTEPQEVDPDLDDLTQDQLAEVSPVAAAVARVHDQWLREHHGFISSNGHWAGDFLDLLAAEGYRVEPMPVLRLVDLLPAATD